MSTKATDNIQKSNSLPGVLLISSAVIAIIAANVPIVNNLYNNFWSYPIEFYIFGYHFHHHTSFIINDGLMSIFFLLIALELKAELIEGELSSFKQALLPCFAALGGMIVPASIYCFYTWQHALIMKGWAIPSATDIAFSLAVLSLLGSRVPIGLRIFLTALAVADDIGAIIIIAIFYTANISFAPFILSIFGIICMSLLNKLNVKKISPYAILGFLTWAAVLQSGIHATLAGVALGLCIPHRKTPQEASPLVYLEKLLTPYVSYLILPLFAFANSGVSLSGITSSAFYEPVTKGIFFGLLIGKPLGIFLFSIILVKIGFAKLPLGANWLSILGIGFTAGIGFTMSLFIGMLAFKSLDHSYAVFMRMGVFGGSLFSALLGYLILKVSLPRTS